MRLLCHIGHASTFRKPFCIKNQKTFRSSKESLLGPQQKLAHTYCNGYQYRNCSDCKYYYLLLSLSRLYFTNSRTHYQILYVPFFNNVFQTAPIPLEFWFIPIPLAIGMLVMDEIRKLLVRSFPKSIIAKIAW